MFVLLCLAPFSEHRVLRVHPRCSVCQHLLVNAVDGPHFVYPSSGKGHLGHFHLLATVNRAAVSRGCKHLFGILLPVLSGLYPEVESLGHIGNSMLNFSRKHIQFSTEVAHFPFPPAVHRIPIPPHPLCFLKVAILMSMKWRPAPFNASYFGDHTELKPNPTCYFWGVWATLRPTHCAWPQFTPLPTGSYRRPQHLPHPHKTICFSP